MSICIASSRCAAPAAIEAGGAKDGYAKDGLPVRTLKKGTELLSSMGLNGIWCEHGVRIAVKQNGHCWR